MTTYKILQKQCIMTFTMSAKIALLLNRNMRQIIVTLTLLTDFIFIIETVTHRDFGLESLEPQESQKCKIWILFTRSHM